ncbi:FISUMP domain-containing protein [Aliarcobacter butzleri]|uniref:Fibrobacter succinogenes major paralogous domain-containing protein n=1 Tax=Aliarcobacter butzleri TaxID=28197 RepID=A0AAW6VHY7_9BACT|nr:FISUMP domain-containing protein [Aliarcobacter butzleri]MDK2041488.1 hypothetical protein [Aliarcobacter butzleri]MDK2096388.1 hypothetical protein [Aliarcobacter butzleri]
MEKKLLSFLSSVFLFLGVNSNAFEYQILDGEQLLGAVYDIKSFTPFDNKCANFLYYVDFQDNGETYVHNSNMVVSGYPTLSELKQGQGFIVNASGNCNVTINEPSETIVFQGLTYKTIQSPTTNKIWLDRNLGALKVCDKKRSDFANDADYINSQQDCFGDYYQWGRKTDGHQLPTSIVTTNFQTSITNTNSQFSTNMSGLDWVNKGQDANGHTRADYWSNSYGTGNAICPTGFKVPTASEWIAEVPNINNALGDIFKLPYGGYRSSSYGNIIYKGEFARLWSTTPISENGVAKARNFNFSDTYIGMSNSNSDRADGMNIRCIKK